MSRLGNILILALSLLAQSAWADGGMLRLQGSNTIGAKLAPALARGWLAARGYRDIREQDISAEEIRVSGRDAQGQPFTVAIHAHGSSTAFTGLARGAADIGMASRRIKPAEVKTLAALGAMDQPAAEHVVGLDGIAVIVNPANGTQSLDTATIRDIFLGRIANWSKLGGPNRPIHVYARDDKSGTFDTFKSLVLNGADALAPGAKRFESNAELSDSVAVDPNGIGFVGLPYVRHAKALAVSERGTRAILPTAFSVATEDYVLARRLYLYLPTSHLNPLAREFVAFAQAAAGQDVVAQVGFVSQHVIAGNGKVDPSAPAEYQVLTRNAKRLSLNFRFRAGRAELDSKGQRDVERLLTYLAQHGDAAQHVMLIGFADHNEVMPIHSLDLSVERADLVADLLLKDGIAPLRVRGYGSALPVASNDTHAGRQKNRRVEVWIANDHAPVNLASAIPTL